MIRRLSLCDSRTIKLLLTIENHCSHYESVQTADMSMIRWTQVGWKGEREGRGGEGKGKGKGGEGGEGGEGKATGRGGEGSPHFLS